MSKKQNKKGAPAAKSGSVSFISCLGAFCRIPSLYIWLKHNAMSKVVSSKRITWRHNDVTPARYG